MKHSERTLTLTCKTCYNSKTTINEESRLRDWKDMDAYENTYKLNKIRVKTLRLLAIKYGLKGCQNYTKAKLIKKIVDHITEGDYNDLRDEYIQYKARKSGRPGLNE